MRISGLRFLVPLLLALCVQAYAQDSGSPDEILAAALNRIVRVETLGGGTFQGELLTVADDRIELLNGDGLIIQVSRREIKTVRAVATETGVGSYFQDASSNHLVIMPTGFGLEPGALHIADLEIVGVTASYGVSSHFSLWGGVSIPGAVFNARFSFSFADNTIGVSAGSFLGLDWFGYSLIAIPYVISSFGSEDRNVTLGAGGIIPLVFGLAPSLTMVVAVGGKTPLSSSTALITENWFIFPTTGVFSLTFFPSVVFRIASNRLSFDIGATFPLVFAANSLRGLLGFPIPILALTYRVG